MTQARIIGFWRLFYLGWDTGMIASHFECREYQVYNAMGATRGGPIHQKALELIGKPT